MFYVTFSDCVSQQWVTAKPDGLSVKWLSAWEPSWGFVRADTLLLCAQLSGLHTEVWEAVCRCGSQLQDERRACDRGTLGLVQGAVGARRRGTGKPELLQQTADRHTDRWRGDKQEGKPTWTWLSACACLSVLTEVILQELLKILLGRTIILQITTLKHH